ncbi:MAG: hypothetical protein QF466_01840 [Desulfobacterales bacterium]|nr:hypothetical protein [Desulfobacterales bacterium]
MRRYRPEEQRRWHPHCSWIKNILSVNCITVTAAMLITSGKHTVATSRYRLFFLHFPQTIILILLSLIFIAELFL